MKTIINEKILSIYKRGSRYEARCTNGWTTYSRQATESEICGETFRKLDVMGSDR